MDFTPGRLLATGSYREEGALWRQRISLVCHLKGNNVKQDLRGLHETPGLF
jgi:hypothetical protein